MIQDYLEKRIEFIEKYGMRPLTPKFHFLGHYGELFLRFGPLIYTSTSRFESKHRYLKDTISKAKNFKNCLFTFISRHQKMMASIFLNKDFLEELQIPDNATHIAQATVFMGPTRNAMQFLKINYPNSVAAKAMTFRGTKYDRGQCVVLSYTLEKFVLEIGVIVMTFLPEEKTTTPHLLITRQYCILNEANCFEVWKKDDELCVVSVFHLKDFYPLKKFDFKGKEMLLLHHAILNDVNYLETSD